MRNLDWAWGWAAEAAARTLRGAAQEGSEAETLANIVEAEGIGQRRAIAARASGVIGIEGLVDHPAHEDMPKSSLMCSNEAKTKKIARCAKPLAYWPLYMAPTPGIRPS